MNKLNLSESQHQQLLFQWATLNEKHFPELAFLVAIPNGGLRNLSVGARMKAEGCRKGFPDLMLPCPRGEYHSLAIELKKPSAKLKTPKLHDTGYLRTGGESDEQIDWILFLRSQGWLCAVAYGWEEARDLVLGYLNI